LPVPLGTKHKTPKDYDPQNYIFFYLVLLLQLEGMKSRETTEITPSLFDFSSCFKRPFLHFVEVTEELLIASVSSLAGIFLRLLLGNVYKETPENVLQSL